MTALDAGVLLALALLAAGGYRQGLLRGLLRLAGLLVVAAVAALLAAGLTPGASAQSVLLRAGLLFGGVLLIGATAVWLLDRSIPVALENAPLNKWLGILPALLLGLLIGGLVVGVAQRIAVGDELERYLARGLLTGRLARPVQWIEHIVLAAQY